MRHWLIGILAGLVLAYAVLEAQTPAASQSAVAPASAADTARATVTPGNVTQSRVMADAGGGRQKKRPASFTPNVGPLEQSPVAQETRQVTDRALRPQQIQTAVCQPIERRDYRGACGL